MATKSKLELAVETGQWEGGLRKAQTAMKNFEKSIGGLEKATDSEKQTMAQFIKILGDTKSTAATASQQAKEYRATLERLQVISSKLSGEQKKLADDAMAKLTKRMRDAKAQADDLGKSMNGTKGGLQQFTQGIGINVSSLTKMGAAIGAAKLAMDAFEAAVKYNVETALHFEKSMSTLSSLTGMAGEDLDTLKQKAIELGSTTTQSASQAADAMAIIGSKRPDLLESAYALSDVTKAAITMSEAAGMEVPEAAESLAAALNIFQMESDKANRVINVLAAGSKLGAAGIQELGEITFRAGGMAKKAGLSFEEFAGAAEVLRPAFGSAEDAGQAFNKFLMKLEEKMDDNCKPSVVGFQQAMKNLKEQNLDTNESLKIFTVNGVKAYDAIMANVDGLDKMIQGVTGTNTATEQANTNTDNLAGSMASLSSAWEGFNLALNDSNGALKTMVDWLADVVTWATNAFTELGRVKSKMDEINNAAGGETGGQTRIESEMSALRGSSYKTIKQKSIGAQYDKEIEALRQKIAFNNEYIATRIKTGLGVGVGGLRSQNLIYKTEMTALQNLKKEFYSRSNSVIKKEQSPAGTATSGDGANVKALGATVANTDKAIEEHIKALKAEREEVERGSEEYKKYTAEIEKYEKMIGKGGSKHKTTTKTEKLDLKQGVGVGYGEFIQQSLANANHGADGVNFAKQFAEGYKTELNNQLYDLDLASKLDDSMQTSEVLKQQLQYWEQYFDNLKTLYQKDSDEYKAAEQQKADKTKELSGQILVARKKELDANAEKRKQELIAQQQAQVEALQNAWNGAASAISSVGSALQQIEDPRAKVAGIIAQAIANIAGTFAASLKGTFTPWDWIAGAAAGAATMASTVAAIKSVTAEYHADGGFVGGGPKGTDTINTWLTPGELVLNEAQQSAIASRLTTGSQSQGNMGVVVEGEKMFTCLANYMNRSNKRLPV